MKKIIICCDGTWNKEDAGGGSNTNVLKLIRSLEPDDGAGNSQVVFYDEGVGTSGFSLERAIGGATGLGISKNIRDCYYFLANNYQAGDEIYCFGFSRGAYTVRSFAGLLSTFGLLSKDYLHVLPQLYTIYQTKPEKRAQYKDYQTVQDALKNAAKPRIKVMGVWDTVGALGAPTPLLGLITRHLWVKYHDVELQNTDYAYHALAIDECRKPFKPSIWTTQPNDCQEVKQVWFSGVHSNIGGGYANDGLSDIALAWMVKMVSTRGLRFNAAHLGATVNPNHMGQLVDSYSTLYKLLGPYLRPVGQAHHVPPTGTLLNRVMGVNTAPGVNELIHESVLDRINNAANLAPSNPETYNRKNRDIAIALPLPIEP